MKVDARRAAFVVAPALMLALWTLGCVAFLAWSLAPDERAALLQWIATRIAMLLFLWLLLALALGVALHRAWEQRVSAPARLAERAQALVAASTAGIAVEGSAENRALAGAFAELLRQRAALHDEIDARVREASREVERQRNRLAALMAELAQGVIVCNLDGVILLYNRRARGAFEGDPTAPGAGGELIGLGRSIHAVFDRALLEHAFETIRLRLQRGEAHPAMQFLTAARGDRLLRVQMVPVHGIEEARNDDTPAVAPAPGGFVLMIEDVTGAFAEAAQRDRATHELLEGSRASLGNLQAAFEVLDDPGIDDAARDRLRGVIHDEIRRMGGRLHDVAARDARLQKTRWPLENVPGADLLAVARRRIEAQLGCRVDAGEVDPRLWLRVDSFSLLQALGHLAARLVEEHAVRSLKLRLSSTGTHAHLDLAWQGVALSTETVTNWETDEMHSATQASALSVRDVVERHGGEMWFQRERARQESFFRLLLPLADPSARLARAADAVGPGTASRPEYYDFDLFGAAAFTGPLADRRLAELTCTVFDTETTGLDPNGGDRIVQIGATRIVAGKLLRHECFERLVDPQREVSAASVAIHGLEPAMLAGQPCLEQVLPAFHAFARDSVLVGHNAAFDMRFLQQAEEAARVAFDQPVLDTLLLSAYVHPHQASHSLEAIAERFGVALSGRHNALGDALVTAEIFLKLIPLLNERGIRTLGEALDASRTTWHARLRY